MSNLLSRSKEVVLTWWIVAAWFLLFTGCALGTATVTALYGQRWNEMDSQDHAITCVLIFVNWATVMMAFLNKAASKIQRGELPITSDEEGNTVQRKTIVAQTETIVNPAAKENP